MYDPANENHALAKRNHVTSTGSRMLIGLVVLSDGWRTVA
jgi:hypothetical protein